MKRGRGKDQRNAKLWKISMHSLGNKCSDRSIEMYQWPYITCNLHNSHYARYIKKLRLIIRDDVKYGSALSYPNCIPGSYSG